MPTNNKQQALEEMLRLEEEELALMEKLVAEKPKVEPLEAGIRGGLQGISFGLSDEAIGAVKAVGEQLAGTEKTFVESFREARDIERRKDIEAQRQQPGAFIAGEVAGSVPTAFIPGLGVAKGAKIGQIIAKGALGGGVVGFGKSEADLTKGEAAKAAKDILTGAAVSAGTAGALNKVLKIGTAAPELLKRKAGEKAAKAAIGNQARVFKMLAGKDTAKKKILIRKAIEEGADPEELHKMVRLFEDNSEAVRIGQKLLKEGTVTLGAGAEKIHLRSLTRRMDAGNRMGSILDQVDEKVGAPFIEGASVGKALRKVAADIGDAPPDRAKVRSILDSAEFFETKGKFTLGQLQELKNKYKFTPGDPSSMALGKQATNKIERALAKEIESGVRSKGGRKLSSKFKQAKSDFGDFATISEASRTLADREAKNQAFGLTDKILLAGDIASGGAGIRGMMVAGANKVLRERGNAAGAIALNKLGNMLEEAPEKLLGRFSKPLAKAMRDGPAALAAAHLSFMDDPEYREMIGAKGSPALERRGFQGGR
jgi:hypothetical protein